MDPDPDLYPGLGSAWGAYSEYAVVHDAAAYEEGTAPECAYGQTILPEDVDPVDGAMIVTLREVLSSIKRFGIKAGSSVAVFGCGPVGLTFIRFMSLLGVHPLNGESALLLFFIVIADGAAGINGTHTGDLSGWCPVCTGCGRHASADQPGDGIYL